MEEPPDSQRHSSAGVWYQKGILNQKALSSDRAFLHIFAPVGIDITMLCERGVTMDLKVFRDTLSAAGNFCAVKAELPIETEILISDYLPQVFKIVKCFVRMVVLQKKLQPGHLSIDGYLRCEVYYQGENGAGLCQTEQKIPFSKMVDVPAEEFDSWSAVVDGEVEYLNCRAVNQRRVEIRGAWALSAMVYTQRRQDVVCAVSECGAAQKQTTVQGLRSIAALDKLITAEAEFVFEKMPEAVLEITGTAVLREKKLLRGKAVLKGEIHAVLACRAPQEETLYTQRVVIPFGQVVDVDDLAEDCLCSCVAEPVGFTLENKAETQAGSRIQASVMLHLRACRSFEVQAVQDAFSTQYEVNLAQSTLLTEMPVREYCETQNVSVSIPLPEQAPAILSSAAVVSLPEPIRLGSTAALRSKVTMYLLYRSSLDEIECLEKSTELLLVLEPGTEADTLHPECWVSVESMRCIPSGDAVEVSAALHVEGLLLRSVSVPVLADITLDAPLAVADPDVALRIYYAQAGEQVFDIAKRFHVMPAQILRANALAEDTLTTGTRLLVPCAE